MINEYEIQRILENEYGFHTVYMEDYTLQEKVNLMANASIVVSIDGTSIINAIFSIQEKVKAITIRSYDFTEAVAIALAHLNILNIFQ